MEWLQNNWIWIAIAFAFVTMHFFGHGGHGVHRRNHQKSEDKATEPQIEHAPAIGTAPRAANPTDPAHAGHAKAPTDGKQHRHGC